MEPGLCKNWSGGKDALGVQEPKPALLTITSEDLSLSGPALVDLLQGVLDKGAPFGFKVKGSSMYPFIKDGDVITLSPLTLHPPRLGTVVAFVYPGSGKLAVHRVVGKKGDSSLLIMGDRCSEPDGAIPKINILGVVTRVERDGKRISLGHGPERVIIAFLTRRKLLPLFIPVWKVIQPLLKKPSP